MFSNATRSESGIDKRMNVFGLNNDSTNGYWKQQTVNEDEHRTQHVKVISMLVCNAFRTKRRRGVAKWILLVCGWM